jgi:hypothetical protein
MTILGKRLIIASFLGLTLSTAALAQEAPLVSVPFDGTEAFGHILHSFNLKPVFKIEDAFLAPEKTLVVIFGELAKLSAQKGGITRQSLEQFRARQGALLLASDYPDASLLPFKLSCRGQPVHARGQSIYNNYPRLVVTRWLEPAHPLCRDLKKDLVTNCPSFLQGNQSDLKRLAEFSEDCVWKSGEDFSVPEGAGYMFCSPGSAPAGDRALVLAGQGVFLNGMLIQTDNDNFAFAWHVINWLGEAPGGRREVALFIDDGKVITNFALPLSKFGPVPIPPIQVVNRMIRGLEDENIFNRLLMERIGKAPYLKVLLLLGSVLALLWGAWRLMHARFGLDTGVPLVVGKQDSAPAALPVLWQRREELRRLGNLWEPAQALARQFFLDHADAAVPLWDEEIAGPPPLATSGTFWQRRVLKRQVQRLWNLARSSPAWPVSPRQFDDLLRLTAFVTAAVADGRVVFSRRGHDAISSGNASDKR